jgi:hypothetical protein
MTTDQAPTTPAQPAKLFRPSFLVVALVLLTATVALHATVHARDIYFKKLPVPLAKDLRLAVPGEMGPWRQANVDERFTAELEEALGTEDYIQRIYVDTRKLSPEQLARLDDEEGRKQVVGQLAARDPSAVVWLHLAYYTGSVDTVPHIPDRCMVAGGLRPTGDGTVVWPALPEKDGRDEAEVTLRKVTFSPEKSSGLTASGQKDRRHVAYFFQVNGKYAHDPLTGVRQELGRFSEKYGYFCKIELMNVTPDPIEAAAAMEDFLIHGMPGIEAALPDFEAFKAEQADEQ